MTNAEFIANLSPIVLGSLQVLGRDADWHASYSLGMNAVVHDAMRELVARRLVTFRTIWPPDGRKVTTYYRITAVGWLVLQERERELDNTRNQSPGQD